MKTALFWEKNNGNIKCNLCHHHCTIPKSSTGFCGVRKNINGELKSLTYGKAVSSAIDHIEKKPLYHFYPGSNALSIATMGCTLKCHFCQNYEIAQLTGDVVGEDFPPKEIIKVSNKNNVNTIAWTYTEPTIAYEYFYDTAKLNKKRHVWITNGYTEKKPIKKASKYLDAVNIDYKGPEKFYTDLCSGKLKPVQESIKLYKKLGVWVEVTNLIIPGFNDDKDSIKEMRDFLAKVDENIPLHISRFMPCYKMSDVKPTPLKTLKKAYRICKEKLNYVYVGNIPNEHEDTDCHNCNELLIKRSGFNVTYNNLDKGKCPECDTKIPGVFK